MIEWLNAAASLVTPGGVATLIGMVVLFSKEWKAALEAKHQSELAEKDRMIKSRSGKFRIMMMALQAV